MSTITDSGMSPQTAGDVIIHEVMLIDRNGDEINIHSMLIELNLFEDIFSNTLSGSLLINDGQNLIQTIPIIGEEYIRIRVQTPGFDEDEIYKTFRIYHISDRQIIKDDRIQQYTLHFCSNEAIVDSLLPLSKTFSGQADVLVGQIFQEYLQMPRNLFGNEIETGIPSRDSEDVTSLVMIDESKNNITFTSPRWTPFKCINWLAARSVPKETKGCNQLLFETSKAFVFGSIEQLIKKQIEAKMLAEHYIVAPNNIRDLAKDSQFNYKRQNISKEYRIVESFTIDNNFNTLQNLQNGYYANKLYKFDVINKDYKWYDFDYVAQYEDYSHLETSGDRQGGAFFTQKTIRNPDSKIAFYPTHPGLYNDAVDNVSDNIHNTIQNRESLLNDLNNYKITVVVPGRTDMEVGLVVRFDFPAISAKDRFTSEDEAYDRYLGGLYLITAIRHKIIHGKHMMVMELIKDSAAASLEIA